MKCSGCNEELEEDVYMYKLGNEDLFLCGYCYCDIKDGVDLIKSILDDEFILVKTGFKKIRPTWLSKLLLQYHLSVAKKRAKSDLKLAEKILEEAKANGVFEGAKKNAKRVS